MIDKEKKIITKENEILTKELAILTKLCALLRERQKLVGEAIAERCRDADSLFGLRNSLKELLRKFFNQDIKTKP